MNKDPELEDVLEGYAMESAEGNDPQILSKWISDFPQFAEDLKAFAADRSRVRHLPDPGLSKDDISDAMERGRAALLQFREKSENTPAAIDSLTALARERGMKKAEFAKAVGLSLSLLMQLETRQILALTVPSKVVGRIAEKLEVPANAVHSFLKLPQVPAEGNFKAESRPVESPQQDFTEAVLKDRVLSDEEKRDLIE